MFETYLCVSEKTQLHLWKVPKTPIVRPQTKTKNLALDQACVDILYLQYRNE
jgi:hypothetical protein